MTGSNRSDSMTGDQRTPMTSHTPGPWRVEEGFHSYWDIRWGLGSLASVPYGPSAISPAQSEANARLIAAAPDMLAALKHVRQWLGTDLFHSNDVYQERCEQSLALIRAAIARAEGK